MATENNNKSLNVPNKGEQSQTRLGYADRAEQSPQGNVPNLRFPEFSGEWERCTLGDVTTNFSRRNKEEIRYPMFSVTNNRGFVPQSEQFEDREMVGEDIKAYKIIHKNDFAYNPARINVGSIAKYNGDEPCMISSLYVCFTADKRIDNEWLMQLLKTPKMNFYYNINGEGGVRVYLFYPNFARIRTAFPSVEEQKKISAFLSLLDDRIATQIKIIEDLKKLKSAISNEIFEHDSNRKCELKEIASVIMGQSPSSLAYNNNAVGLPLVQGNLDIGDGQLIPRVYTSETTQKCKCGDVILTVRAPVGEIAIAQQEACIGRGVCSIRPHENDYTNLLYQFLQYFKPKWAALEQGSTFTAVSGTGIRGISVSIPTTDKIQLLDAYDNKIVVESSTLTNLHLQKQYLLAQMFM